MKDIKGYEGIYAITRDGKIWAYSRIIIQKSRWGEMIKRKWRGHWSAINTTKKGDWYMSISFGNSRSKNRKGFKVHRLVAEAYIPNPLNLPEVNHKNGNKGDNRVENLEWCNRKQNLEHGYKLKNSSERNLPRGEKHWASKLTVNKVLKIRKLYKNGINARQLGFKFHVSGPTIQMIVRKIYWKHV